MATGALKRALIPSINFYLVFDQRSSLTHLNERCPPNYVKLAFLIIMLLSDE